MGITVTPEERLMRAAFALGQAQRELEDAERRFKEALHAVQTKDAMTLPTANDLTVATCWCHKCSENREDYRTRMILCPICGNKRCPHASDHDFTCTGSNEPGQAGSRY